ncbi:type II toxin-antitoxin system HicB family antitoxin [Endothiovibrio diazotrophicus]
MLYPVYVHLGDDRHAHGVTIPDLPGCFSAADDWQDLPAKIQDAVELYFDGEEQALPPPTPLEVLARDPGYSDGVWLMVEIGATENETDGIPIEVRLPERLVKRIDDYARSHHLSRSGVLAEAAERVIDGPTG